jgi:quercetin dioxygenase-like cupin family protein
LRAGAATTDRYKTDGGPMQTIVPSEMPVAQNPMGLSVRHLHETPHVMMSMLTLEPGETVAPHAAPVDVAFFVVEGSPVVQIEEESRQVGPHTLVPSMAGHQHGFRNDSDVPVRLLIIRTPSPNAVK